MSMPIRPTSPNAPLVPPDAPARRADDIGLRSRRAPILGANHGFPRAAAKSQQVPQPVTARLEGKAVDHDP